MMLGNLSIDQIEKRIGVKFPDKLREIMQRYHQEEANNIADGFWHCFDMPFIIVCGNYDLRDFIIEQLLPFQSEMEENISIAVVADKPKGYVKGEGKE